MAESMRILVCCGTSAVTSTVMMERIQRKAGEAGFRVEVFKCLGSELKAKAELYKPTLIVTTLAISADYGVPLLSGIPYLTGIGADGLDSEILDILRSAQGTQSS